MDDLAQATSSSRPLCKLAALAQSLRATRSRLAKAAAVREALIDYPDADLAIACRLLCATPFSGSDARTLSIGPSTALCALQALCLDLTPASLRTKLVAAGDLATLAQQVLPYRQSTLTLAAAALSFASMARTGAKPKQRESELRAVLAEASPTEAFLLMGVATGELRLGLALDALLDALAKAFEVPLAKAQRLQMLLGDIGETAVRLRAGNIEAALVPFHPLAPMLAKPFDMHEQAGPPLPWPLLAQDKYDGIRLQVHLAPTLRALVPHARGVAIATADGKNFRLALFTRTGDDVTASFPDLHQPLLVALLAAAQNACAIFDGELLAIKDGLVLPFRALQVRLGRKAPTPAVQRQAPATFVAFDILAANGALLLEQPLTRRLAYLATALKPSQAVWLTSTVELAAAASLPAAFAAARARGHEGLVLKEGSSPYEPGKRQGRWRKVKLPGGTLDVVVTAAEVGFGRKRQWLSDLTFAVRKSETDAGLVTLGKAYSGLTDVQLTALTALFEQHTRQVLAHGRVRLVEPLVVLEVAFDFIQPSKRHKSGYALRFARIVRVRDDKRVADIDTLERVRELAKES